MAEHYIVCDGATYCIGRNDVLHRLLRRITRTGRKYCKYTGNVSSLSDLGAMGAIENATFYKNLKSATNSHSD